MLFSKLYEFFTDVFVLEESARKNFFIQRLDPRVKIIAAFTGIICVSLIRNLLIFMVILSAALLSAAASRISLKDFIFRSLGFTVLFTTVISIPLLFTTPGRVLAETSIIGLTVKVTWDGVYNAAALVLRVWTALTLLNLLVMSTSFDKITAALSALRAPRLFTVIFDLTLKYIFIMVQEAMRVSRAQEARRLWKPGFIERVKSVIPVASNILLRSHVKANNIYNAMLARGFNGGYRSLQSLKIRGGDLLYLLFSIGLFSFLVLLDKSLTFTVIF